MSQPTVEIEAPRGSKFLILSPPADWSWSAREFEDMSARFRAKIQEAKENDDWPVIIGLAFGWTVRWLEAGE
jgi:hypothetical protein